MIAAIRASTGSMPRNCAMTSATAWPRNAWHVPIYASLGYGNPSFRRRLAAKIAPQIVGIIETRIDSSSDEFRANCAHYQGLVSDLRERLARATAVGGEESVRRHRSRGKLLPRERVERLLDPGTPFLELSPLAANGMYDDEAPSAGIVTGIGSVHGKETALGAHHPTVQSGTV